MGARKRARRAREATLFQIAVMAILCGLGILIYAAGEMYADHRYDNTSPRLGVSFCFLGDPPAGVPRCRGMRWSEVAPTSGPTHRHRVAT